MNFQFEMKGFEEAKKILSSALMKKVLGNTVFNTSQDARKDLVEEIKVIFDRPTPFIVRGVRVLYNRNDISSDIGFENFPIGKSPADIIRPHVEGGIRPMKRSEKYLRSYWVPGGGARLDKYGNISAGQVTQVLSSLGRLPEVGYTANITGRSRKRNTKPRNYFVVGPGNKGLHPGVWERLSNQRVRPILIFVGAPQYYKRLKFHDIVKRSIQKNVHGRFDDAFKNSRTV